MATKDINVCTTVISFNRILCNYCRVVKSSSRSSNSLRTPVCIEVIPGYCPLIVIKFNGKFFLVQKLIAIYHYSEMMSESHRLITAQKSIP